MTTFPDNFRFCPDLLREIRDSAGFSITSLAKAAHVNRTYLSEIENGHKIPGGPVLGRLAAVLAEATGKKPRTILGRFYAENGS